MPSHSTQGVNTVELPAPGPINDARSLTEKDTVLVPPSGHVAGIFATSDAEHGVHKAPANEVIRGAIGRERVIDDAENGELNVEGEVAQYFTQAFDLDWDRANELQFDESTVAEAPRLATGDAPPPGFVA